MKRVDDPLFKRKHGYLIQVINHSGSTKELFYKLIDIFPSNNRYQIYLLGVREPGAEDFD